MGTAPDNTRRPPGDHLPGMSGKSGRYRDADHDHEGFSSYLMKSLRGMKILRDHEPTGWRIRGTNLHAATRATAHHSSQRHYAPRDPYLRVVRSFRVGAEFTSPLPVRKTGQQSRRPRGYLPAQGAGRPNRRARPSSRGPSGPPWPPSRAVSEIWEEAWSAGRACRTAVPHGRPARPSRAAVPRRRPHPAPPTQSG
jgi:hypothetical protein